MLEFLRKVKIIDLNDINGKEILDFSLVVDRLVVKHDEDFKSRVSDSVQLSFYEGKGVCSIYDIEKDKEVTFSNKYEMDGIKFIEPSIHLFSFNNPLVHVKTVMDLEKQ